MFPSSLRFAPFVFGVVFLVACGSSATPPADPHADAGAASHDSAAQREPDAAPIKDEGDAGASGTASVTGTISGESVPTVGVQAATFDYGGPLGVSAFVVLENQVPSCAQLINGTEHANHTTLTLQISNKAASSIPAGTYSVGLVGTINTELYFTATSAQCVANGTVNATSGTVVLTSTATSYAGTFDVMFDADHVTGSFHSLPACDGLIDAGATAVDASTCLP